MMLLVGIYLVIYYLPMGSTVNSLLIMVACWWSMGFILNFFLRSQCYLCSRMHCFHIRTFYLVTFYVCIFFYFVYNLKVFVTDSHCSSAALLTMFLIDLQGLSSSCAVLVSLKQSCASITMLIAQELLFLKGFVNWVESIN